MGPNSRTSRHHDPYRTRRPGRAAPQAAGGAVRDPLIILGAPRSFTSVVCAMLGQHPEMYGLPEVNLFVAETMAERRGLIAQPPWSEHGLLRAVAQLFGGEQTIQTIA